MILEKEHDLTLLRIQVREEKVRKEGESQLDETGRVRFGGILVRKHFQLSNR